MQEDLEFWGGVECTVNRVGDAYFDQLEMSGHAFRNSDLDRFVSLGIKTLRFPLLWERMAPDSLDAIDWTWSDERLQQARERGISVIAGLVHHGSGPRYTHLLDPEFPDKLAVFAGRVAERYPWIKRFTPINEPLTTARFSGLYGHWYPHLRSTASFLTMLLNECRAVRAAMRAIRQHTSDATLIQTEDVGRVFSTSMLAYQAAFENKRRWLSFDLLCGRLQAGHPLWSYCLKHGLKAEDLREFAAHPCPPDLLGINHYITSHRFLDERLERYPTSSHGGNGRHRYADIEAVRVGAENVAGPLSVLEEVWNRYQIPIAVTEVHLGCSRDEQVRWLSEMWTAAETLRTRGVPLRAVTAWSLLGSYDWDSLVTRSEGHYEPGVFDLRGEQPRPTALAQFIQATVEKRPFDHPILDRVGWWHRPDRLLYPAVSLNSIKTQADERSMATQPRELLIIGAGTLATAFAYICESRGLAYRRLGRNRLDASDEEAVRACMEALKPWAVINAAGFCGVDAAELHQAACFRDNVEVPRILAQASAAADVPLLTFSSDLVFNGQTAAPYLEGHEVGPLNVYGQSKALAERAVKSLHERSLIIRTSAFFGPWDESNFLTQTLRRLAHGKPVAAAHRLVVSPTYVPDLVHASLDLLIDGERGTWHLANHGALSWFSFAQLGAELYGYKPDLIQAAEHEDVGWLAPRPTYSALGSERGCLLPSLERALDRFRDECRIAVV